MNKINEDKVRILIAKLDSGGNVSMRDLQNTLGAESIVEYNDRWQVELDKRELFADKPDAIKEYEDALKLADFANNRADGIKHIGKRSKIINGNNSRVRLRNSSETLYENALEILEDLIHADRSLDIWFDRPLDFSFGGNLGIDVVGIPRVVTGRSNNKITSGAIRQVTKKDIKRDLLEYALTRSCVVELTDEQKLLMKRRLARMRSRAD